MPRYGTRRRKRKALTPEQTLALANYEPHLSAETRRQLVEQEVILEEEAYRIGRHNLRKVLDACPVPIEDEVEDEAYVYKEAGLNQWDEAIGKWKPRGGPFNSLQTCRGCGWTSYTVKRHEGVTGRKSKKPLCWSCRQATLGKREPSERYLQCERCRCVGPEVKLEDSRTQYHFEGELDSPDNPNRARPLCRPCAKEHHEHWDEMWAEYNSGRL